MRLMENQLRHEPIEPKTSENDSIPAAEPATAPIVQESKPEEIESTVADISAENAEIEFLTNENGQMMLF